MKLKLKTIISIFVLILIAGFFVYYIYNHISDFKQIELINPLWLIPLIALFLLSYFFIGLQTKTLLEPLGAKLKHIEVYMLSIVTGFYNLITPAYGGMFVRATYLKKKHLFSFAKFFSVLAGMYVMTFFINSLFGLGSLIAIWKIYDIFNLTILLVFLGVFLPLLGIIIFSPKFHESKNKIINKFVTVINGWHIIRNNKKAIVTCLIVTICALLISSASLIIEYYVFGIHISFIKALFLASISSLLLLVQITPGNLGVAETVAVFSALILGITPAQSLSVAILGRIVQMITMFTLGPIFSIILLKHKPKGGENVKKN